MGKREEIINNREFWEKVLGSEICEKLLDEIERESSTETDAEYRVVEKCFRQVLSEKVELINDKKDINFYPFYRVFGQVAIVYAKKKKLVLTKSLQECLLDNLYNKIVWIPLRVLILDIYNCKEQGTLLGKNREEEYEDYCEKYLNNKQYVEKLCDEYPEMKRLLLAQVKNQVLFLEEIMQAVHADVEEINRKFFFKEQFNSIERVVCGQSDAHRQGRTVTIVYFDNGGKLVYKPRNLGKEIFFEELYRRFCDHLNLTFIQINSLNCNSHGWQEFVENKECKNEEEVRRYYIRMGILLFISYFFSATDIHGENIIAAGEQPVIIDLETMPGSWKANVLHNAEDLVKEELKTSVLSTGILPVCMWQQDGKGTIVSALHGNQITEGSITVPVVLGSKRSDISIGYRKGITSLTGSMVRCNGKEINSADYMKEMCSGFESAYKYYLKCKDEIHTSCVSLFSFESRYLIRHTQQYNMLAQISLYPEFLKNHNKRNLILYVLNKSRANEKKYCDIMEYERKALFQLDIPFFSLRGDSKILLDSDRNKYDNYVEKSIMECWREKQLRMGYADLQKQIRYIKLSMALLLKLKKNDGLSKKNRNACKIGYRKNLLVEKIADKISELAIIYDNKDINFSGLYFQDSTSWNIAPMGMYLYDGIAGLAIFFAAIVKRSFGKKYMVLFQLICEKLFRYTEYLEIEIKNEIRADGAMLGEGSIVNTYLILYEVTGNEQFLKYAERHCNIVINMAEQHACMDFLSGSAGTIVVLVKLYKYDKKEKYIQYAKKLEKKLWDSMKYFEEGCGWSMSEGEKPLVGFAHGNSGLLFAYAYLLDIIPQKGYLKKIEKLLAYENSLYDELAGNWKDLRQKNGVRTSVNSWCHGATGILLTRVKLKQHEWLKDNTQIELDMDRALSVLEKDKSMHNLCICHGQAGTYYVLNQYVKDESPKALKDAVLSSLLGLIESEEVLHVDERENISLMVGLSGVGLVLCGDDSVKLF